MPLSRRMWSNLAVKTITFVASVERFTYRITLLWGIWLIIPFYLFVPPYVDTFDVSRGLTLLNLFAREEVWGLVFILVGLRLYRATKLSNLKDVRDSMFGAFILWLFTAITIALSNPIGTGTVVYGFIVYNIWWGYITTAKRFKIRGPNIYDTE